MRRGRVTGETPVPALTKAAIPQARYRPQAESMPDGEYHALAAQMKIMWILQ
ncbi:MAG: hypothetical protein ACOCXO_01110 [Bacteroidota bacterium]